MVTSEESERRRGHTDLRPRPMPAVTSEEWHRPGEVLERLRTWAEGQADEAIEWYLRDKAAKRRGSRTLRALAILLAVAGAVVPLVTVGRGGYVNGWGYALLAAAAGCVAFDHFFGLSSGWRRDVAAIQALQARLADFRYTWLTATAEQALNLERLDTRARLELIERFVADVRSVVNAETSAWLTEFEADRPWPDTLGAPRVSDSRDRPATKAGSAQGS